MIRQVGWQRECLYGTRAYFLILTLRQIMLFFNIIAPIKGVKVTSINFLLNLFYRKIK